MKTRLKIPVFRSNRETACPKGQHKKALLRLREERWYMRAETFTYPMAGAIDPGAAGRNARGGG